MFIFWFVKVLQSLLLLLSYLLPFFSPLLVAVHKRLVAAEPTEKIPQIETDKNTAERDDAQDKVIIRWFLCVRFHVTGLRAMLLCTSMCLWVVCLDVSPR